MKAKVDKLRIIAFLVVMFTMAICGPAYDQVQGTVGGTAQIFAPNTTSTFTQVLTGAGFSLSQDFLFGSSVSARPGQTPVTNTTQLATYFHPLQDYNSTTRINSEIENYATTFNTTNHVFNTSNLTLTASKVSGTTTPTLVANGCNTAVNLNGTSTTIGNFCNSSYVPLSVTTGMSVGQLVAVYNGGGGGAGLYYVSALVSNTSVTLTALLGSSTTAVTGYQPFMFLPYYYATLNGAFNTGGASFNVNTLPAAVASGMTVCFANNATASSATSCASDQTYTVASTGTNSAVLSTNNTYANLSSGQGVFFLPQISSGQMWLSTYYAVLQNNGWVAAELTARMPFNPSTGGAFAQPINSVTAFSAVPTTAPAGAWPAFWIYQGASSPLSPFSIDTSEIDITEMQNSATQDMRTWSGIDHGKLGMQSYFQNTATLGGCQSGAAACGGGLWGGNYYFTTTDLSAATHKFQIVWGNNGAIMRYIDGIPVQGSNYHWSSQAQGQIGINLAIGSLLPAYAQNLLFPYNDAEFPVGFQLTELKVWTLQQ